ncbi:MAG: DNA translocase FtsK 4TM domain-containing protein, partial [Roseococcus sp.]
MARDATSAAAAPRRFASPAVRAAIARRLGEFAALLLGLCGLALLLAVASYDPADPSLSTATARPVGNLLSTPGAMVADVLRQGVGWMAFLPGLVLLAWALRLAAQRGLRLLPLRLAALLLALPLGAALLAELPGAEAGAAGPLLARALTSSLADGLGPSGALAARIGLAALWLWVTYTAFGLSFGEWGRAARVTAETAARGAENAARFSAGKRHVV